MAVLASLTFSFVDSQNERMLRPFHIILLTVKFIQYFQYRDIFFPYWLILCYEIYPTCVCRENISIFLLQNMCFCARVNRKRRLTGSNWLSFVFPWCPNNRKAAGPKHFINFFLGGTDTKSGCLDLWPVPAGILQYRKNLCTLQTFMRDV